MAKSMKNATTTIITKVPLCVSENARPCLHDIRKRHMVNVIFLESGLGAQGGFALIIIDAFEASLKDRQ